MRAIILLSQQSSQDMKEDTNNHQPTYKGLHKYIDNIFGILHIAFVFTY